MFKRLSVLWTVIRGDARMLWLALRHPQAPGWVKWGVGALLGMVDDVVLLPLAIRFMLRKLPAALRAEIGAGAV